MTRIWPRLVWALAAGATGLVLILVGVEKSTLLRADAERRGLAFEPTGGIFVYLSLGVLILNFAVFGALTVLARYRRAHPAARQAPVWVLLVIVVVAGGLGLAGYVAHAADIGALEVVPLEVDWGFIALQGLLGTITIAALVVMGVRWSPGHRPARARH